MNKAKPLFFLIRVSSVTEDIVHEYKTGTTDLSANALTGIQELRRGAETMIQQLEKELE